MWQTVEVGAEELEGRGISPVQIFPYAVDRLEFGLFEQEADNSLNDFLFLPLWAEA